MKKVSAIKHFSKNVPFVIHNTNFDVDFLYMGYRSFSTYMNKFPEKSVNLAYSKSVNEFFEYLTDEAEDNKWKRYIKTGGWNSWVTKDKGIRKTVEEHFPAISQKYALLATSYTTSQITPVAIRYDKSEITYEQEDFANPTVSICSGGISALFSAYITSLLYKEKIFSPNMRGPVYIKPIDIKNSASMNSTGQFYVGTPPFYANKEYSTLGMLYRSLSRNLFTSESPEKDNYMIGEIHPDALLNPTILKVGMGYLWHEMKYKIQSALGQDTILDETIPLAIESGNIMDQCGKELNKPLLLRKNTLRVAYNKAETHEMEALEQLLAKYKIKCVRLSLEEAEEKSGVRPRYEEGGSVWEVEGDGNLAPDIFETLCEGIEKNGGQVIKGEINNIICDHKTKRVKGVTVNCGLSDGIPQAQIIGTHSLYTSFGAMGKYSSYGVELNQPIEPIIPASGYSAYLLIEGEIKRPIDSNNSHFTPLETTIVDGKPITLVKTTCGGAIGTENFNIDHAINSLFYATHIMFPDKKVEIISAKSCSRPINTKNSGKITEVVPGFFVATGFGGKGMTDGASFAMRYAKTLAGDKTSMLDYLQGEKNNGERER